MSLLKPAAYSMATLMTAIPLFFAVENWQGTRDYEDARNRLAALGEELDYARLIPARVEESANFGSTPLFQTLRQDAPAGSAQSIVEGLTNSLTEMHEAESPQEFEAAARRLMRKRGIDGDGDNPLAFLERQLEPWQLTRRELADRLPLPHARWNRSITAGQRGDTHPVLKLPAMPLMKLLRLQARIDVMQGKSTRALEDIEISLRLGEMHAQEPGAIFHVLFLANIALILSPLEEGLQEKVWDADQLNQLARRLGEIDLQQIFVNAIRGERAYALSFEGAVTQMWGLGDTLNAEDLSWQYLAPRGWALRGLGRIAESFQDGLEIFESRKVPFGVAIDAWEAALDRQSMAPITAWTAAQKARSMTAVGRACLETAQKLAVLKAALDIMRFRLANDRYPNSLTELPVTPRDPRNNQPVRYERTPNGFLVELSADEEDTLRFRSDP